LGATSCEEALEKYPRASMADEEAMADIEGIEATLAGLYNRLQTGSYNHAEMNLAGGLLADQLKVADANSGRFIAYPTNREATSSFSFDRNNWAGIYNDINRINMMLYYIDDVEATEDRVNRVKGQAKAMRGYLYFDLMKIFARPPMYQSPLVEGEPLGVIIKTDPFLGIDEDTFAPRSTIDECYELIQDDFESSLAYLPDDNPDFPYYFTDISVRALLARLHLFLGNWQEAVNYAEEVIAYPDASLVEAENYLDAFADAPGAESIFELGYTSADRPGMNTSVQGLAYQEGAVGYGDIILRHDLQELLDEFRGHGDVRPEMTKDYNKEGQDVVYQTKFRGYRGERYWDDIRIIRTAEMFLIAAEAHAELGQFDQARDYLVELRDHRVIEDVDDIQVEDNLDDFIDFIMTERRVEFFSEMSHRWFDLRRRGMDIPKGCPDNDPGHPVSFDDYRVVGRIPNAEIEANENCIQNPGY